MTKKKTLITLGCMILILLIVGISYAYWSLTFNQKENNVVTTDCFEIEFIEGNAINLSKAYPMSDSDGMKNVPYTFTIKNVCDGSATYQINLETMTHDGKKLPDQYLKANLMENNVSKITTKLESSLNTETTIDGAISAYQLLAGDLEPNETKEFSLRLWMHSDVTANDKDSMNATYNGKISIITSYAVTLPTIEEAIKNIPVVTSGNGLYEVNHSDANITYTSDQTAINNLKQTEYRFAGPNPNNYVKFNNELWRMIGLVNTPEGQRVKLIRNEKIGNYSWDSSISSINTGSGVNEWSQSKMMNLLNNGAYYNRTSGTCYNRTNNTTTNCDFSSTGLTEESKSMIDTVTWNLGSIEIGNLNPTNLYNTERSNKTGKICSSSVSYCTDTVVRTTSWLGQIGLMYVSDYGYATSGGTTTNRETCVNMDLESWSKSERSDCKNNDWLYKNEAQWTLTSSASLTAGSFVFMVNSNGKYSHNDASFNYASRPTIYLKSNVKIDSGDGTESLPFELIYKVK